MTLTSGGNAPYAPPGTVIDVITRYRERGMQTPFTTEILERAGVSESLSRRTLQTLKLLELVDAEGKPAPEFERATRASDEEYREQLSDILISTYSEVISFADPAQDSYDRVRDAFRGFNPRGQQDRMVTLFLGLLDFVGMDTSKASGSRSEGRVAASSGARAATKKTTKKSATPKPKPDGKTQRETAEHNGDMDDLPPALVGLLRQIPSGGAGWPASRRDEFLAAFAAVLNYTIPVRDIEPPPSVPDTEEDSS